MRKVCGGILGVALFLVVAIGVPPAQPEASLAQMQSPPNILFILTDDQDARSIRYMPTVQKELIEKGTTFENSILTTPVCCPSRATMLRGQYTHNHGITAAGNAARLFLDGGLEKSTVATWLDQAGYRTTLVGKYINGYAESLDDSGDYRHIPPGWDRWYANASKDIWAECLNENGKKRCYKGRHPDHVLAEKAEGFVRANEGNAAPLFLWLAFTAPHAPAPYMDEDRNKFGDKRLPRPPSFNEKDVSDKPSWVRSKPQLTREEIRNHTRFYRDRLRSLQTVDRAVGRLIDALADTGRLNNTYVVFWTDNGHHIGEHRLGALPAIGKATPYAEDIRVPLIVRGPSVPQVESQKLVLNTDIAPTFAQLARTQPADFVDGRSFVPLLRGETTLWRTAGLIESRGSPKLDRPAFAGVFTRNRTYVEYESGEKELYDLKADPYQLQNMSKDVKDTDPTLIADLETRLEALRTCEQEECRMAENGSNP